MFNQCTPTGSRMAHIYKDRLIITTKWLNCSTQIKKGLIHYLTNSKLKFMRTVLAIKHLLNLHLSYTHFLLVLHIKLTLFKTGPFGIDFCLRTNQPEHKNR